MWELKGKWKLPWLRTKKTAPRLNTESISSDEAKKRQRERLVIFSLAVFFSALTYLEIHLANLSQKTTIRE